MEVAHFWRSVELSFPVMNTRTARALDTGWHVLTGPDAEATVERWMQGGALDGAAPVSLPTDLSGPSFHQIPTALTVSFDCTLENARAWELSISAFNEKRVVLNGHAVPNPSAPFLDVSASLRDGENRLAITFDTDLTELSAGLAGPPRLLSRPAGGIQEVFVQPDLRRNQTTVTVITGEPGEVKAAIAGTDDEVQGAANEPFTIPFAEYARWEPGEPAVYTLSVSLERDGAVVDRTEQTFGMREFSTKDDRFVFNGRPRFLRAVRLDATVERAVHGADADAPKLVLAAHVDRGGNVGIVDVRNLCPAVAEAAEAVGLPLIVETALATAAETVRAWRGATAIVGWLFRTDRFSEATLIQEARNQDPSRLLIGAQPNCTGASCVRPYRTKPHPLEWIRVHADEPATPELANFLRNLGTRGIPTLVDYLPATKLGLQPLSAELREGLATAIDHNEAREYVSGAERAKRLVQRIAELQTNPNCAGCLLPDTANLSEESEASARILTEMGQSMLPVIGMRRTNLVPREETAVVVHLANEGRVDGRADLSLQVVGPTNQVLWKKKRNVKIPKHGKELWAGDIAASGSTGPHRFVVRLLGAGKVLAEASRAFDVIAPLGEAEGVLDVLEGAPEVAASLGCLGYRLSPDAPVLVVPPVANTIRAYPDNQLARVLGQARAGAVAVIFGPPQDWNDFASQISPELCVEQRPTASSAEVAYRYARLHPVFDKLPARSVMGRHYRQVAAQHTLLGDSEEDICGTLMVGSENEPACHGRDIVVRRYENGRVVFLSLNVLEHLERDPVAQRLFDNIHKHFARRSMPSTGTLPIHQPSVEWLRTERATKVVRWRVIGPFANPSGEGHTERYAPEDEIEFDATYPGWYSAAVWRDWYTTTKETMRLDLDEACRARHRLVTSGESGTYYAYAEFGSEFRANARLSIKSAHAIVCWFNRREALRSPEAQSLPEPVEHSIPVPVRQGRNAVLVKVSKTSGTAWVDVEVTPEEDAQVHRWTM